MLPQLVNIPSVPVLFLRLWLLGQQAYPGRTRFDLYLMIVEMPVPLNGWELACEVLGDEVLNGNQWGFWIGGLEEETLKNLVGNAFAVMVEWPTRSSVRHHMRRLDMNVVSDGRTGWFPTHRPLSGHSTTSNRSHRDYS